MVGSCSEGIYLKRRAKGFTLIELMVVVVVVAILAAIAYPNYLEQVRKSRRAEAKATLSNVAQTLERCYTRFGAYQNAAGDCSAATNVSAGNEVQSESDWYRVTADVDIAAGAQTYSLTAVPQGAQADDTDCGNFTLTHTGQRGADAADCW